MKAMLEAQGNIQIISVISTLKKLNLSKYLYPALQKKLNSNNFQFYIE